MKWIDPRKEPVVWLGVTVAVLQAAQAYFTKSMDLGTAVNAAFTAIGTLVVRNVVTPSFKVPAGSAEDVENMEGIEDVSQDPDFWDDEEVLDDNGE